MRGIVFGSRAGCLSYGRRTIRVDDELYMAARLAWLYMTGRPPVGDVDHKNLDKGDDRWENLREATRSQNLANKRASSRNVSGFKSCYRHPETGRWRAQIMRERQRFHLGYFDTPEEASAAYEAAAKRLFGEFARVA